MLTRLLVCAFMAAARLAELRYSRRNLAGRHGAAEGSMSSATFPAVVALHSAVIGGTALFGSRRGRRAWLLLLAIAQPLRVWVLATLADRWNVRGAVAPDTPVETSGPYRYVRHPNYAVVAVELFSLPATFGLTRFAVAATAVNAALLTVRIRDEEAMLFRLPGYAEHFAGKARLVPGLF